VTCLLLGALAFGAACGGGDDDDDSDDGNESGSTPEATADGTAQGPGSDPTSTAGSGRNQGGGDSNADADDMDALANDLEPDEGREAMRFAVEGGFTIAWETGKSLEELKSFYDDRLDDLDLNVQGELDLPDSHTWIIGPGDGDGIQGTLTISKASSGTSDSIVSVALTNES
jgi:hypothetical protein